MPGLFDRLKSELDDDDHSGGVTPLDIINLPDEQRLLMLWMLRDRTASTNGVTANDIETQMTDAPANSASLLQELARTGWLIGMGEAPRRRYRVNLRRKRGGTSGFGLWSLLADRIAPPPKDQ